jgi:hypothetical protein
LNLVRARGPEGLQELKTQVLGSVAQTLPDPDPDEKHGSERRKQLTLMRAEQLFQEIEAAAGISASKGGPKASN